MHPNFVHFHQKISFKSTLEIFTPVSGHLRIALRYNISCVSLCYHTCFLLKTNLSNATNKEIQRNSHFDIKEMKNSFLKKENTIH